MSSMNPANPQPGGVPPKKGMSPLVIILIVVAGLFVLAGLAVVAGGLFIFHKAKQAGIDTELMRTNLALAVAKMVAATNPDIEVVDVDESAGKITLREKSSGKTVTLDFEQVKQGRISFETTEGQTGSIKAGEEGARIRTQEGTFEVGAAASAKLPDWLPAYPGATVKGTASSQTAEGRGGMVAVLTKDSVEEVSGFYRRAMESAGLKVNVIQQSGETTGAMITGASSDGKRHATVLIGTDQEGTTASVNYNERP
jgi:hypothetical protein